MSRRRGAKGVTNDGRTKPGRVGDERRSNGRKKTRIHWGRTRVPRNTFPGPVRYYSRPLFAAAAVASKCRDTHTHKLGTQVILSEFFIIFGRRHGDAIVKQKIIFWDTTERFELFGFDVVCLQVIFYEHPR